MGGFFVTLRVWAGPLEKGARWGADLDSTQTAALGDQVDLCVVTKIVFFFGSRIPSWPAALASTCSHLLFCLHRAAR